MQGGPSTLTFFTRRLVLRGGRHHEAQQLAAQRVLPPAQGGAHQSKRLGLGGGGALQPATRRAKQGLCILVVH